MYAKAVKGNRGDIWLFLNNENGILENFHFANLGPRCIYFLRPQFVCTLLNIMPGIAKSAAQHCKGHEFLYFVETILLTYPIRCQINVLRTHNQTITHRIMFEFGGQANLAGFTLLDIQASLNGTYFILSRHCRVSQIGQPLLRKLSNIPYIVGNHPSQTDF